MTELNRTLEMYTDEDIRGKIEVNLYKMNYILDDTAELMKELGKRWEKDGGDAQNAKDQDSLKRSPLERIGLSRLGTLKTAPTATKDT